MARPRGWTRESYRHSLAARGVITTRQKTMKKDLSGKTVMKSTKAGHEFLPWTVRDGLYSGAPTKFGNAGKAAPGTASNLGQKTADEFFAKKEDKKDDYAKYARSASRENVEKAAEDLPEEDREKYKEFMEKSFISRDGNFTSPGYAKEWVGRFKGGRAWTYSDYDRRKVLKEVFPEKYGKLKVEDDAKWELEY